MAQSILEDLVSLGCDLIVLKANHDLIIDVQASLIEVRRSHVNDIIDDDQFGCQDLWLIFVNRNARFQKAAIKTLGGQLREGDIRFSSEDHLDPAAVVNHTSERAPQSPGREKISHDDLNVAGMDEVSSQGALDWAGAASRSAQQNLV